MNVDDATVIIAPEKLMFRVNEACRALGIGRSSFYGEVSAGRLITIRAAGRTLVHRRDLEAYCEARRAESLTLH
jgi:excisionase family DNA binding protein